MLVVAEEVWKKMSLKYPPLDHPREDEDAGSNAHHSEDGRHPPRTEDKVCQRSQTHKYHHRYDTYDDLIATLSFIRATYWVVGDRCHVRDQQGAVISFDRLKRVGTIVGDQYRIVARLIFWIETG